ncbi:MAG: protein kinase [Planctomycetaceae bacterium]|nr:protein kinase [Planctomycetaceae bacterium]
MDPRHEQRLHALLEFERAWERGTPYEIRDYTQRHHDDSLEFLAELVVLDSDCRWRYQRNDFWSVEGYQNTFPEIAHHPEVLLDLICIEVLHWPSTSEDKYRARFPRLADEIGELFQRVPGLSPHDRTDLLGAMRKTITTARRRAVAGSEVDPNESHESLRLSAGESIQFVDECRIVGQLDEGSHKWVYHAWQASTGQPLALKQLKRISPELLESFISEGRAQANLDHQNIPPTMMLGPNRGEPTMVAERLVQGTPWSDLLQNNSLTFERNLSILLTVSRATAYAHRMRGIVHRDIKPGNVMIGQYGEIYLVDWGLAVRFGSDVHHLRDEQVRHLTQEPEGVGMGTPAYMAPELAMGRWKECCPATDVFQLGAILYELLAERPPFIGSSRMAFFRAAMGRFPELPDHLPAELKSIVATAMALDPKMRYSDAGHFAEAIQRYFDHRPAEEQFRRTYNEWQRMQQLLGVPRRIRSELPHQLVTKLIAIVDGFRQATQLWQSNSVLTGSAPTSSNDPIAKVVADFSDEWCQRTKTAESAARRQLIDLAIESGDLVLAQSQVEELRALQAEDAAHLSNLVSAAQAKRQRLRRQRIGLAVCAGVLLVVVASLAVMQSRAEKARVEAESRANVATANEALAIESQKRIIAETESRQRTIQQDSRHLGAVELLAKIAQKDQFQQSESIFRATALELRSKTEQLAGHDIIGASLAAQLALTPQNVTSRRIMTLDCTYSPSGRFLVSGDTRDCAVRVWSTTNWRQLMVLNGHKPTDELQWSRIRAVEFVPGDESQLVSAGSDGSVRTWDLTTGTQRSIFQPAFDESVIAALGIGIAPTLDENGVRYVIVARRDGTLIWLDSATLTPVGPRQLVGHDSHVNVVRIRPDGKQMATAGGDGNVKLWTLEGHPVATMAHPEQVPEGKPVEIYDLSYSPDGKILASCGEDGRIHLWDPETWQLLTSLAGHPTAPNGQTAVRAIAWLENRRLFSGGSDGSIRLWDTDSGDLLQTLVGHGQNMFGHRNIRSIAVNPINPKEIASVGRDDSIFIWDLDRSKVVLGLEGMQQPGIEAMTPTRTLSAYARKADTLITADASVDAYIRSWNAATLREKRTYNGLPELTDTDMEDRIDAVAIRPDGKEFVSAEPTGELIFWNTDSGEIIRKITAHSPKQPTKSPALGPRQPSGVTGVAWSLDGQWIATVGHDKKIKLWHAANGELHSEWSDEDPEYRPSLPPSFDELPKNRQKQILEQQTVDHLVCFSGDNQRLITAGRDHLVRIWNMEAKSLERRLIHLEKVTALGSGWDGRQLVSGTSNGRLSIWDYARDTPLGGTEVRPLLLSNETGGQFGGPLQLPADQVQGIEDLRNMWAENIHSVAFSPDGNSIACTLGDGTLTLVEAVSYQIKHRGFCHEAPAGMLKVECLFTKQGHLLTIGNDKSIRRWDLNPWEENMIAFSNAEPQGDLDLAAGPQGQWVTVSESCLQQRDKSMDQDPLMWRPVEDHPYRVTYIPKSDNILVGTRFGRAIVFEPNSQASSVVFDDLTKKPKDPTSQPVLGCVVAASSDGTLAASSRRDGSVVLWRINDGTNVRTLLGSGSEVMAIAFRPDGQQLAVSDFNGACYLWDLTQSNSETPLALHGPQQASGLDYSPCGSRLVQSGQLFGSDSLVVWDTITRTKVASLKGHSHVEFFPGAKTTIVPDADFSADGKWLATCSADGTTRLWNVRIDVADARKDRYEPWAVLSTRRLPLSPDLSEAWLSSVSFSADSKFLGVASKSGKVRVYDLDPVLARAGWTTEQMRQEVERVAGLKLEQSYLVPILRNQLVPMGN